MKTITLSALFLALIFSGCEKDDNNNSSGPLPTNPTPSGSFTLTVNGNNIVVDSVFAALHIDTIMDTIPHRIFAIAAYWGGTHEMQAGYGDTVTSLILPVGSYNSQPLFYFDFTGITIYSSSSAQFTLTSVDASAQKASGTFSGIAIGDITPDTVTINGVFSNLHYDIW